MSCQAAGAAPLVRCPDCDAITPAGLGLCDSCGQEVPPGAEVVELLPDPPAFLVACFRCGLEYDPADSGAEGQCPDCDPAGVVPSWP